jgi:hypothetical protein
MEALVERLPPKVTEDQLVSRRCGVYGQGNDPAVTDVPCPTPSSERGGSRPTGRVDERHVSSPS